MLIRVLTLGTPDPANKPDQSVIGGLAFMWNPEPEKLKDPQTWLAASGQILFSLSVGFGIIINYSSYMRRKDDVVLSGLTILGPEDLSAPVPTYALWIRSAGGRVTHELGIIRAVAARLRARAWSSRLRSP